MQKRNSQRHADASLPRQISQIKRSLIGKIFHFLRESSQGEPSSIALRNCFLQFIHSCETFLLKLKSSQKVFIDFLGAKRSSTVKERKDLQKCLSHSILVAQLVSNGEKSVLLSRKKEGLHRLLIRAGPTFLAILVLKSQKNESIREILFVVRSKKGRMGLQNSAERFL